MSYLWYQLTQITDILNVLAAFKARVGRAAEVIFCHPADLSQLQATIVGHLVRLPDHGVVQKSTVWIA